MYRYRQLPKYSPEALEEIYKVPHCHLEWADHIHRVDATIEIGRQQGYAGKFIADLSCGDGAIAKALSGHLILGDFAPGYPMRGAIETTIHQIPDVEVFILSETIEHLDDPEMVLELIRAKSQNLLLSTPKCSEPDGNDQHYWVWDDEAMRAMLEETGWSPTAYVEAYNGMGYTFQIWACE